MLAFQKDDTLLDVGSGHGFSTARLAAQCAAVTGIEPEDELRGYAQTLYARPNVTYLKGAAELIPFQDATFDKKAASAAWSTLPVLLRGLKKCPGC